VQEQSSRIAFGLIALVALWIGVYWWWPTAQEPKGISFAAAADKDRPSGPAPKPQPDDPLPANPPAVRPAPPTPPPVIIPPQFTEHTIAQGDTYATISMKHYGTSAYATAIAKANPLMSPTSLRPGRIVRVPKDPKNIQGIPIPKAGPLPPYTPGGDLKTEYIVESGDTLSTIASRLYGDSKLAHLIFEANKASMRDEDSLKVGQKLMVPPKPRE